MGAVDVTAAAEPAVPAPAYLMFLGWPEHVDEVMRSKFPEARYVESHKNASSGASYYKLKLPRDKSKALAYVSKFICSGVDVCLYAHDTAHANHLADQINTVHFRNADWRAQNSMRVAALMLFPRMLGNDDVVVLAAAEHRIQKLSPLACLEHLESVVSKNQEMKKQVGKYEVTLSPLIFNRIKILVSTPDWERDGFYYYDAFITRSRREREDYPVLFDASNDKRVAGDIYNAHTPAELLRNAINLTIKTGERKYKSFMHYKKQATGAAEPAPKTHEDFSALCHALRDNDTFTFMFRGEKMSTSVSGAWDNLLIIRNTARRYPRLALSQRSPGEVDVTCVHSAHQGVRRAHVGAILFPKLESARTMKDVVAVLATLKHENKSVLGLIAHVAAEGEDEHAQAAAEPVAKKLSPNEALEALQKWLLEKKELKRSLGKYEIKLTSLPGETPGVTVHGDEWDPGFFTFNVFIGTSRSSRGTYPALFDMITGSKVVGDIHRGVDSVPTLLKNALQLAVKSAEADYKAWLRTEARAKKGKAQAAAETDAPTYENFTVYGDKHEIESLQRVLKTSKLEHVRATIGTSKIYRWLVPVHNVKSELALALMSNCKATVWLEPPEKCALATGAIELDSTYDMKNPKDKADLKFIVDHFVKYAKPKAATATWFVADVDAKNADQFEQATAGVALERVHVLAVGASTLVTFKVGAEPVSVLSALSKYAVSARVDTDADPVLVFASEWRPRLPEFIRSLSSAWGVELS